MTVRPGSVSESSNLDRSLQKAYFARLFEMGSQKVKFSFLQKTINEKNFHCFQFAIEYGAPWVYNNNQITFNDLVQTGNVKFIKYARLHGCPPPDSWERTVIACAELDYREILRYFRTDKTIVKDWPRNVCERLTDNCWTFVSIRRPTNWQYLYTDNICFGCEQFSNHRPETHNVVIESLPIPVLVDIVCDFACEPCSKECLKCQQRIEQSNPTPSPPIPTTRPSCQRDEPQLHCLRSKKKSCLTLMKLPTTVRDGTYTTYNRNGQVYRLEQSLWLHQ